MTINEAVKQTIEVVGNTEIPTFQNPSFQLEGFHIALFVMFVVLCLFVQQADSQPGTPSTPKAIKPPKAPGFFDEGYKETK